MKKFNTGRCFIADRTKPYQVNHPSYGDLVYDTENCVLAVVLGNSVQENGSIWCVAWDEASELYGTEGRPSVKDLEIRGKIDFKVLVKRMEQFAKEGQAHAKWWWLGCEYSLTPDHFEWVLGYIGNVLEHFDDNANIIKPTGMAN